MSTIDTVETLLELAITAEQKNMEFYQGLSKMFSHQSDAAFLWQGMVMEEVQHAQELENIRKSLTAEQLHAPVKGAILAQARKALMFSVSESLNSISTLDDAYQTAHALERSEVNTVFSFITSEFVPGDKQKEFILWQLENHTQKMVKFPELFGDSESRKKILSKPAMTKTDGVDSSFSETKIQMG
jgi:rubrerythrin